MNLIYDLGDIKSIHALYVPGTRDTYDSETVNKIKEKLLKDPATKKLIEEAHNWVKLLKTIPVITKKQAKSVATFFEKAFKLEEKYNFNFYFWPANGNSRRDIMTIIEYANNKEKQKTELQLAKEFVAREKVQTGDLKKALYSDVEIYINGEYIAFATKIYLPKLSQYFGIKLPYDF